MIFKLLNALKMCNFKNQYRPKKWYGHGRTGRTGEFLFTSGSRWWGRTRRALCFFLSLASLAIHFQLSAFSMVFSTPTVHAPPPQGQIQNVGKNTLLKPIFILTCATKTHTRSTISKLFYSSKQIMPIQTRYIWNNQISCFQALFPDYNWWFHTVKPASENNTIG